MKALVFAAGLGTRLSPLTDNLPKALAPIAGKTLLYYVMMRLKDAGITEFVINIHHFPDKIIDYVRETEDFAGLSVRFSDERDLLRDTGGGVRFAKDLLESSCQGAGGGRFLVHNVDIVSDLDLRQFCSDVRPDALSTLLVGDRKTRRYLLFDGDMRLVGWTDASTGEVKTAFRHIDVGRCRMKAFGGIHLMSEDVFRVFDAIDSDPERFPLYDACGLVIESSRRPLGKCFPIMDFYLRAAAEYPIYGKESPGLTLMDAGRVETLAQAEKFLISGTRHSCPEETA